MNILDLFYNNFILEACKGKIDAFFTYNIVFSTRILDDNKEYLCDVQDNELMIPTLMIKNKKRFDKLLIEYVEKALEFYEDDNFPEEIINNIDKNDMSREKIILAMLFSNATMSDFIDFENYLQRRINFMCSLKETNGIIGYSGVLKSTLEFEIKKDIINNEAPFQFVLKCKNTEGLEFVFPKISFGISNNKIFIYAIQNSKHGTNEYTKKINRILYKIGENFDSNLDNASLYGDGNLNDVTPSFLFVSNIFISMFRNFGYDDFIIVPFLVERWNAKRIACRNRSKVNNSVSLDDLFYEQERIQNNLTQKLVRTFLRLVFHYKNLEVINYPNELDESLIIRSNMKLDNEINNSLLNESDFLVNRLYSRK